MLGNLSEKLEAKFPSTAIGCSLQRISHLDDTFSGILLVDASPVEGHNFSKEKSNIKLCNQSKRRCKDSCFMTNQIKVQILDYGRKQVIGSGVHFFLFAPVVKKKRMHDCRLSIFVHISRSIDPITLI